MKGYAFILEGDTEKEFYLSFLEYLCEKHNAVLNRFVDESSPDVSYTIDCRDRQSNIKFKVVNAVTQLTRSDNWFNTQCVRKHGSKCKWDVFLCYDTDSYNADISKYFQDDWAELRKGLSKASHVLDLAAAADIEDIMLIDLEGVCNFLNCQIPKSLPGAKGKIKMKNLFRENGQTYHEGERARPLIDSLNMEKIIESNVIALARAENMLFPE